MIACMHRSIEERKREGEKDGEREIDARMTYRFFCGQNTSTCLPSNMTDLSHCHQSPVDPVGIAPSPRRSRNSRGLPKQS